MAEFNINFDGDDSAQFDSDFDDKNFEARVLDGVNTSQPFFHNDLKRRDDKNAHPISAITGLDERLEKLEESSVTTEERDSWNNKSRVYRNASGALIITI